MSNKVTAEMLEGCARKTGAGALQNPMEQLFRMPELAFDKDFIMCNKRRGIVAALEYWAMLYGSAIKPYKSSVHYTGYVKSQATQSICVEPMVAAGAPGADVTLTLTNASHTNGGSLPIKGYTLYIPEKEQQLYVVSTNKTSVPHTMVVRPINGNAVDLTSKSYTILVIPSKTVAACDQNCIETSSQKLGEPEFIPQYIMQTEDGDCTYTCELDGMGFESEFRITKGIDEKGMLVDQIRSFGVEKLMERMEVAKAMNMLFGQRDVANKKGIDGLITQAHSAAGVKQTYAVGDLSLVSYMRMLSKKMFQEESCKEYNVMHDRNFGIEKDDSLAAYIGSIQKLDYTFFKSEENRQKYMENFTYRGVNFYDLTLHFTQVETFGSHQLGGLFKDYAIGIPACELKTARGQRVLPIQPTTVVGEEGTMGRKVWFYDRRMRGCKEIKYFGTDTYGLDVNCISKFFVLQGKSC
jgi:hypothetical protein